MNAGVPIKRPVSAVAMGMIYDEDSGDYKILSDIQAQDFRYTGSGRFSLRYGFQSS